MIEDEMRRRPSVADDIANQSARPMPREVRIGELITVLAVVLIVAALIWLGF